VGRGAGDTCASPIKRYVAADEVDRDVVPGVRDGIGLAVDLDGAGSLQTAEAQLFEKDEEPPLSRQCRSGVGFGEVATCVAELHPGPDETIPGADDRLVQWEVGEVIVLCAYATEVPITVRDPLEEIGGQEAALGADCLKKAARGAAHAEGTGSRT
jgi:hypothetical protein